MADEWRLPDGSWTSDPSAAVRVSNADISAALRRVNYTTIPDAFFWGLAARESSRAINNRNLTDQPGGSWGLYQVSPSEQAGSTFSGDLNDIDVNTGVMSFWADYYRGVIRAEVGLNEGDPDDPDMGAYLGIAHNRGLSVALCSIRSETGGALDWRAVKALHGAGSTGCTCQASSGCLWTVVTRGYGDALLYDPVTGSPSGPGTGPGTLVAGAAGVLLAAGILAALA